MKEISLFNLNGIKVRKILLLINYSFAVLGIYRKLSIYFINRFGENKKDINIKINLLLYLFIIIITLILSYPLIRESIINFKKTYINELISILSIMGITLALFIVIMKKLGIDISTNINQINNENSIKNNFFYFIFVTLIYAPIVEEIIFRGVLYENIKNTFGNIAGVVITSILFAFLHKSNSISVWNKTEVFYIIVYFIMGVGFNISYYYTKSIVGSIINHFIWNLSTLIPIIIRIYLK